MRNAHKPLVAVALWCAATPHCTRRTATPLGGTCTVTCAAQEAGMLPLVATLRDSVGDPLEHQQVEWRVTNNEALTAPTGQSDAGGHVKWQLPVPQPKAVVVDAFVHAPDGRSLHCGALRVGPADGQGQQWTCTSLPRP